MMRISFDLDGVITDGHHWFFRLLQPIRELNSKKAEQAELDYYGSRSIKYHPYLFLAETDTGIIITARKPLAQEITLRWLDRYGIKLPVYFIDSQGQINWESYAEASKESARLKAEVIVKEKIEVHFDNNPTLVQALRECLPEVKVILIGGER